MKKIVIALLFCVAILLASDSNKWEFKCNKQALLKAGFGDERYITTASAVQTSLFVDKSTIEIETKNNNIIRAWIVFVSKKTDKKIKYGYSRELYQINIKNNKVKLLTSTAYKCDGDVLSTYKNPFEDIDDMGWEYIVPNSVMDVSVFEIKKRIEEQK